MRIFLHGITWREIGAHLRVRRIFLLVLWFGRRTDVFDEHAIEVNHLARIADANDGGCKVDGVGNFHHKLDGKAIALCHLRLDVSDNIVQCLLGLLRFVAADVPKLLDSNISAAPSCAILAEGFAGFTIGSTGAPRPSTVLRIA